MKMSPGFKNIGCNTIVILIVLGIVFFLFAFFVAVPLSFFVSDLMGGNMIIQRAIVFALFALYFLLVYFLITYYLKRGGSKDRSNK